MYNVYTEQSAAELNMQHDDLQKSHSPAAAARDKDIRDGSDRWVEQVLHLKDLFDNFISCMHVSSFFPLNLIFNLNI